MEKKEKFKMLMLMKQQQLMNIKVNQIMSKQLLKKKVK